MKVYFIGAGPGARDLITVRGAELLKKAPVVLYAGSLVPPAVLGYCRGDAELIDTAGLNLDEQCQVYSRAAAAGADVARLHSGDPSIYSATAEQMRRLEALGIEYEVVPGVSSFTASAAALCAELTKPGVTQTVILTRVAGRTPVPEGEAISQLATHGATLCIFLSGPYLDSLVADLLTQYPPETPIALVFRVSQPQERIHKSTLGSVLNEIVLDEWKLTTMVIVGDALACDHSEESRLYAPEFAHLFRNASSFKEDK